MDSVKSTVSSVAGSGSGNDSQNQQQGTRSIIEKGVDYVQSTVTGQPSSTSSSTGTDQAPGRSADDVHKAIDEAHPEHIGDFIRDQHKSTTDPELFKK